jgi:hypothetical protein
MFWSLVPHRFDQNNDRSARQWNGKAEFFEDTNSILASVPQQ